MPNFGDANLSGAEDKKVQRKHNYLIELLSRAWQRVWTQDNDGAGSTLDADYLDALDSTDFARANMSILASTDLDNYVTPGMYACRLTATAVTLSNTPIAAASMQAFSLLVEKHAGYKQTLSFYSTLNYSTFIRNQYSGSWGSWVQIIDADGKSTNANMLDGVHADATADATAATHYWFQKATDGYLRPKTLANVRTEVVSRNAVRSAISETADIADDSVAIIDPGYDYGMMFLYVRTGTGSTTVPSVINFRTASTNALCTTVAKGSAVDLTTGVLAGTTGTDGKVTISAHTDGKIYIENRLGAVLYCGVSFVGI